jgi:hypothetical protein
MRTLLCAVAALAAAPVLAGDFPQAAISNGLIDAKLYLPDPERGYYRGTRFDWSGVIYSLRYRGHEFFGPWFERHDPKIHDAITGPVEEFQTDGGADYAAAPPGGTFVRIGVGTLRKPEERAFQRFATYDIVDPGRWRVRQGRDRIEFVHEVAGEAGYVYRKTVRLVKNRPQLVLEHALRNTGRRALETTQYNHNFFVIDGRPTGPEFAVSFPFEARARRDLKGVAEVKDGRLVYLRELQAGESLFTELEGFGAGAADYDFRVENRHTGAGVRITGDRPLARMVFWCVRTTLSPEPYIALRVEPGRETRWEIAYEFYDRDGPAPPAGGRRR